MSFHEGQVKKLGPIPIAAKRRRNCNIHNKSTYPLPPMYDVKRVPLFHDFWTTYNYVNKRRFSLFYATKAFITCVIPERPTCSHVVDFLSFYIHRLVLVRVRNTEIRFYYNMRFRSYRRDDNYPIIFFPTVTITEWAKIGLKARGLGNNRNCEVDPARYGPTTRPGRSYPSQGDNAIRITIGVDTWF